jgi:DNA-directed RNA polymerase subunit F
LYFYKKNKSMEEFNVIKQNLQRKSQILKSFGYEDPDTIEKGKAANEGEEREWNGKKYKKTGGKWIPVTGDKKGKSDDGKGDKSAKDDQKKIKKPVQSGEPGEVSNHEIAQMSYMKKMMDESPERAYEIYQELSPEAQSKIPQDVVNKIVESGMSEGEDPAAKVFDDDNKGSEQSFKYSDDMDSLRESVSRMRKAYNALKDALEDEAVLEQLGYDKESAQEEIDTIDKWMDGAREHKKQLESNKVSTPAEAAKRYDELRASIGQSMLEDFTSQGNSAEDVDWSSFEDEMNDRIADMLGEEGMELYEKNFE